MPAISKERALALIRHRGRERGKPRAYCVVAIRSFFDDQDKRRWYWLFYSERSYVELFEKLIVKDKTLWASDEYKRMRIRGRWLMKKHKAQEIQQLRELRNREARAGRLQKKQKVRKAKRS